MKRKTPFLRKISNGSQCRSEFSVCHDRCYDIEDHVQTTKHKLLLEVAASSLSVTQFLEKLDVNDNITVCC